MWTTLLWISMVSACSRSRWCLTRRLRPLLLRQRLHPLGLPLLNLACSICLEGWLPCRSRLSSPG
ncbi:hypothetical protein PF007_g30467 [Phytophthora fragariae]|uniref:Uncharacterized protein n=1 Tax=Phytophthora fragariae TaxID=53985 RepID=A0A6A4B182_9STRA|nr:hypothetical protein PF011_g28149 [Phytophthora fragariae]KAE9060825.1 hypothetical protein PF007_g30467 [Phytophthora fragariae]KAE9266288.1 hypothetical protein PF001_g30541 [Phytophthora fragariae]